MTLRIKRMGTHELPLPRYQSDGAAAFDLQACYPGREGTWLEPASQRHLASKTPCGFAFEIPKGYVGRIHPRSSIHAQGIICSGVIDSDYRGEVFVSLLNVGTMPFRIEHGARIAQMVIQPAPQFDLVEVGELGETVRGDQGFGHTGR